MNIEFRKKTRPNSSGYGGGSGNNIDVNNLNYVPCDKAADDAYWLVPDKPLKVLGIVSVGDIIAQAPMSVVFTAEDI